MPEAAKGADGREVHAEGVCEGTLGTKERGGGGFGQSHCEGKGKGGRKPC